MSRSRLNLLLALVVAALVAVVVVDRQRDRKPVVHPVAFGEDAITRIALRHPGKPEIVLERVDGGWRITAPFSAPAEEVEVKGILSLATLQSERQLPVAEVDLGALELDPPRYEVQFNDTVLAVGGLEPIEYRRYLRVGDTVHLVPDPPSAALDADPADLVAKRIVPEGRRIVKLELPDLTLVKADPGWALVPEDPDVSADQLQQLVDAWTNARAMWNQTPETFEEREPDIRITLDDGSEIPLTIVRRDPQLVLGRPGIGIHHYLSRTMVEQLLKLPEPPADDEDDGDGEPASGEPEPDAVIGEPAAGG